MTVVTKIQGRGETELYASPSIARRGYMNLLVIAVNAYEVYRIIGLMADTFAEVTFTDPARCGDHRWGSYGRVK